MGYLGNRKNYPKEITSYDLLKAVAVVLMIVDHVGYYFFPDQLWLRVFGRICVPMWFFLVGYANSRDVNSPVLWIGGISLVLANYVIGWAIFPLNILFTILVVRLVLDGFIQKMLRGRADTFMGAVVILALFWPLSYIFEYGTPALALAFVGCLARHKKELAFTKTQTFIWLACITIFFVLVHPILGFRFNDWQLAALFVGISFVIGGSYLKFKPYVFKTKNWVVSFLGRYTLEIYVVHLLAFKLTLTLLIGESSGFDSLKLFEFKLFP